MPCLKIGWSSTDRIRIGRGREFIGSAPPELEQYRPARNVRLCIRGRSRNIQLDFSADLELAPNLECAAHQLYAFAHAAKAPMSWTVLAGENQGIDAPSIIPDSEPKLIFTVS